METVEVESTLVNDRWWMAEVTNRCEVERFVGEVVVNNMGIVTFTFSMCVSRESVWTEPFADSRGWMSHQAIVTLTVIKSVVRRCECGVWST